MLRIFCYAGLSEHVWVLSMQAAAAVAAAFPPRGGIRLLGREHTQGNRPALERIIGEEYILDSIRFFDGDRVESAVRLATGAPKYLYLNSFPGLLIREYPTANCFSLGTNEIMKTYDVCLRTLA